MGWDRVACPKHPDDGFHDEECGWCHADACVASRDKRIKELKAERNKRFEEWKVAETARINAEAEVERLQGMTVSQSDLISAAYKLARMTEWWSVSDLPEPWQESVQRLVDTVDALDKAKQVERTCPSCGLERQERGYCGCPDRDEC